MMTHQFKKNTLFKAVIGLMSLGAFQIAYAENSNANVDSVESSQATTADSKVVSKEIHLDKTQSKNGGLTPANVTDAIGRTGAPLVDTSSGVETAPGDKDPDAIAAFCSAVRKA